MGDKQVALEWLEECGFLPTLMHAINKFKIDFLRVSWRDEQLFFNEVVVESGGHDTHDPYRISLPGFGVNLFHYVTSRSELWCIPNDSISADDRHGKMGVGVAPEYYPSLGKVGDRGKWNFYRKPGQFELRDFDFNHAAHFRPLRFIMYRHPDAPTLDTLGKHEKPPTEARHQIKYEFEVEVRGAWHKGSVTVDVTFKLPAQAAASSAHSLAHAVGRRRAGEMVEVLRSRAY